MGLANKVLAPGPCLPSKFLFDVLIAYLPAGTLSSFMAKHAEQPGSLISNPAFSIISVIPFSFMVFATICDPGTSHAVTFSAFLFHLTILAKSSKSSTLPLVQLPKKA